MNWRVIIRPKAKADLSHARDWYENQRPGLGDEFLTSQAEALLRLEENPERYPIYYRDFRRILSRRFPYKIFYRVKGQTIFVVRVLHFAQDHTSKLR